MKRLSVISICLLCAVAVTGCSDPTEGKTDAIVGEVIETPAPPETPSAGGTTEEETETARVTDDPFSQPAEGSRAKDGTMNGALYAMALNSGIQFEGSKVTGSHVGGFAEYEGAVFVPTDGTVEDMMIEVTIDMTTVFSDAGGLTEKLRGEEFFDVEKFPTASFKSTSIEESDDGYSVTGEFNLHGVTRAITFPADIEVSDEKVTAEAEFVIKQFDWGIKYRGLGQDMIRDEVLILLDIVANREDA